MSDYGHKDADVIQHLLEIEHEASDFMKSVHVQADEKIAQARAESENKFHKSIAAFNAEIESQEKEAKQKILDSHKTSLDSYRATLENAPLDLSAFHSLLDNLLAV